MTRESVEFARVVNTYAIPARDPSQQRPELASVSWARALAHRARVALAGRPRLAYLDSTFPWERSGFRYHEATALLELAPGTLFFSLWELTDPFPAEVHPLRNFPAIAAEHRITDAYGVFQLFIAGLVGLRPSGSGGVHPMEGLDIRRDLRRLGIRLHGSIYPGGGFTPTPEGIAQARAVAARLATTFSYVPEILEGVAAVTQVPQAFTETRFYAHSDHRWAHAKPIVCMFAADQPPRKGLDVALGAFANLSPREFHLHVVGPHQHRRGELSADLATFHGWLSPPELRELHRSVHVFLSPVSTEPTGPPGTFTGVTDGFPTQAAADAMSGGCLLVSSNPASDNRVLSAATDYIECAPEAEALRLQIEALARDPALMRRVAEAGSRRVRDRMDVRYGVGVKLKHMGIPVQPGSAAARVGTATPSSD
jgi:glycosyltransferase involved in cell wall biosynthesis